VVGGAGSHIELADERRKVAVLEKLGNYFGFEGRSVADEHLRVHSCVRGPGCHVYAHGGASVHDTRERMRPRARGTRATRAPAATPPTDALRAHSPGGATRARACGAAAWAWAPLSTHRRAVAAPRDRVRVFAGGKHAQQLADENREA
jgi:hypothetical protein